MALIGALGKLATRRVKAYRRSKKTAGKGKAPKAIPFKKTKMPAKRAAGKMTVKKVTRGTLKGSKKALQGGPSAAGDWVKSRGRRKTARKAVRIGPAGTTRRTQRVGPAGTTRRTQRVGPAGTTRRTQRVGPTKSRAPVGRSKYGGKTTFRGL